MIVNDKIIVEDKEYSKHSVREFGTDVIETFYKSKAFKSFATSCYIILRNEEKIPLPNVKLKDLRAFFKTYKSSRRVHKKTKKDKVKKATSWFCKIVRKGTISLTNKKFSEMKKCVKKKRIFRLSDKKHMYYVYGNFFKKMDTDEFYYFDKQKQWIINTGFVSGVGNVTTEELEDWKENYIKD